MAGTELTEEARQSTEAGGSADVVVGIAGPVAPEEVRARASQVLETLGGSGSSLRFVFAWPGEGSVSAGSNGHAATNFVPYAAPASDGEFWSPVSANQRAVLGLGASLGARACIVLGSDLAGLEARVIESFAGAILERQTALAMPIYPAGKFDGLINTGILSPLSRALYGKRLRYPLTYDFAASGALSARLARPEHGGAGRGNGLLWPAAVAALQSPPAAMGQVPIEIRHHAATAGMELSAVLAQLVGSLFEEMDACAAHWQRIRGSQPVPVWGSPPAADGNGQPIDAQPMLDSFLLGLKNLDEVWRLIMPPNTVLDVRRLARLTPENFHMPDELWAGIVYDFALAWRLRTISRSHLLGALTPLYLGWAASWVREVAALEHAAVEQRFEQFARAWDEKKPYLLSRWRWPDRFNP